MIRDFTSDAERALLCGRAFLHMCRCPNRNTQQIAVGAFLLCALGGLSEARQTPGPSPADALFVPGDRVPLSEFEIKDSNLAQLHVDPEILAWIEDQSGTVKVAVRKLSGQIVYVNPTQVDETTGAVTLNTPLLLGDCVATTTLLRHDLPIVTHWDSSLNGGLGGQLIGATDAIVTLDLDVDEGQLAPSELLYLNDDANNWEHSEAGQYHYRSDDYALFDDGSGEHVGATVPAFERYIGENYALYGPTDLAAIWLSDQVRAKSGFPIAHRNHPNELDPGAPLGKRVQDDLPLFQVIHAHLVAPPDNLSVAGNEHSLCTYVLPPGWSSQSAEPYPLIFNGQYDIHGRGTFMWRADESGDGVAETVFTTLADLYNHPERRRAVASFWNGGGAVGTFTMHPSAYENAALLIAYAEEELNVDSEEIVFMGGSRGGIAALEMASNPYAEPYKARFVHSVSPNGLRMGSAIHFSNPSYGGGFGATDVVVGWRGAWKEGWVHPGTGNDGLESTMLNLFGTTEWTVIDSQHSVDSNLFRAGLVRDQTSIVLQFGTHDLFHSYDQVANYYDRLAHAGVPVRLGVFYRFGHTVPDGIAPTLTDLMNIVFGDLDTVTTGIDHYGRDPDDYNEPRELTGLTHIPLTFETAISVGAGQTYSWSFVGEPGGRFELRSVFMGAGWDPGEGPPGELDQSTIKVSGTLIPTTFAGPSPAFGTRTYLQAATSQTGWWWYEVLYSPDGDSNYETNLVQRILDDCDPAPCDCTVPGVAPPTTTDQEPVVEVMDCEDVGRRDEARTGGLSEDDQLP